MGGQAFLRGIATSSNSASPPARPTVAPIIAMSLSKSRGGPRASRRLGDGGAVGLHVAAGPARAQARIGVEGLDGRAKVPLDVHRAHRHAVHQGVASLAEPEERLLLVGPPLDLDDEAPGVGG